MEPRLIALEELFTHLQRTVRDLDEVVIGQHKRLDQLDRRVARIERDLESLSRSLAEERSPLDERPPHY